MPYFGLISWQPSSQKTPPSADSGVGIGEFTAISRSASITSFYFFDQRFILFRRQPLLFFYQIILEARDGVALFPEVEHGLRHIRGGVVDGVAFHAHHFGFDHGGAFAAVGALDGFVGGVVDLAGVGAIDDDAGDAVSDGAFGEVFAAVLHFGRRGVGPEIALDEEHEAEVLHGGEVDAFVGDAGGLATVADVGHDGEVASLQARAQRDAGEHGDKIAEHGDGRDHVALLDVAEMRGAVAALGGRIGFGHVLHHGVAGAEAADEQRALVADHGGEPVVFVERVGGGAGAGFLAESEVNSADDFALLVEIFEGDLHFAVEQHVAVDLDGLLLVEIFGVADGRDGRVEIAFDFVADVLVPCLSFSTDWRTVKFGMLQAVVGDGVGAEVLVPGEPLSRASLLRADECVRRA